MKDRFGRSLGPPPCEPEVDYSWPVAITASANGCCQRLRATTAETPRRLWLYDVTDFLLCGSRPHPLGLQEWLDCYQPGAIKFETGGWRTAMQISRDRVRHHVDDDCYGAGSCFVQFLVWKSGLITYDPLTQQIVRDPDQLTKRVPPFASRFWLCVH